jgi:hypothetical protein
MKTKFRSMTMRAKISRREFFAVSAGGITFLGLQPGCASVRTTRIKQKFGGFGFGIQAHALRKFPIDQAVRTIHDDLKLHWVEFSRKHPPVEASLAETRRVRALLDQNDITCNAVGVHTLSGDNNANRRVFEFAKAVGVGTQKSSTSRMLQFCKRCGVNNVCGNPNKWSYEALLELKERCGANGITLDMVSLGMPRSVRLLGNKEYRDRQKRV